MCLDASQLYSRVQRMRPMFGSFCVVEALGTLGQVEAGIAAAFAALAQVQALMHPTTTDSDLARIATSAGQAVTVHSMTWQVLQQADALYRLTDGVFDPSLPGAGGWSELSFEPDQCIRAQQPVRLDLGGIAKGYAVDCAVVALQAAGCNEGLVNAGGDVRVFGPTPQMLMVRSANAAAWQIQVQNAALAVSDADVSEHPAEFNAYYCRGNTTPSLRRRHAAVIAPTAILADALTKCALLCEDELLAKVLQACEARLVISPTNLCLPSE